MHFWCISEEICLSKKCDRVSPYVTGQLSGDFTRPINYHHGLDWLENLIVSIDLFYIEYEFGYVIHHVHIRLFPRLHIYDRPHRCLSKPPLTTVGPVGSLQFRKTPVVRSP